MVYNSILKNVALYFKEPFGVALENQKEILRKVNNVMSNPIIPGNKSLSPFQNGILISNSALEQLHSYVAKYNMAYICCN